VGVTLRQWAGDAIAEAGGTERRVDPVLPGTGGPAGNARLTAWTGFVLLVLFVIELVTLLSLGNLLDWHIVVGMLLVPPALLKTGSTGWRVIGYYGRRPPYRRAGPPPMLLRVLGPLVVFSTLAVVGSGIALVAIGPSATFAPFAYVTRPISPLTIHQVTFVLWGAVTGLHTLARLLPAVRIVTGARLPGRSARTVLLVSALVVATVAALIVFRLSGAWL
jgi:hypothetical protein